ncbi:MAG: DNA repair protein RadC, partial [Oceanisphaera sp.]|nr:DNA repair protein RadC [Oceanisphaera sp.]
GIDSLTDTEIIELLLTFGTPRTDCKQPARTALTELGSLPAVLDAPAGTLTAIKGIGPKNVFALHFIQGVARRYLKQRLEGRTYISSSGDVAQYLIHLMRGLKHEVFTVLYLDATHGIIDSEILSEGTVTVNTVYPRELVKSALQRNASALVIAHNHPSGIAEPSQADRQITRRLQEALGLVDIRVLDHIIVGDECVSLAERGLI